MSWALWNQKESQVTCRTAVSITLCSKWKLANITEIAQHTRKEVECSLSPGTGHIYNQTPKTRGEQWQELSVE